MEKVMENSSQKINETLKFNASQKYLILSFD